ncbi:MAG: DNA repair protein RecO [Elusimicrobiota bacterium]
MTEIYKTRSIVLRSFNFYQADKILTLYTEDLGKVAVLVKGAANICNRFGMCMQIFSEGFFHLCFNREKKGLARLITGRTINSHYGLTKNLAGLTLACWIAEFTNKLTPELQVSLDKYGLLQSCIELIEKNPAPILRIAYGLKFLNFAGYGLNFRTCAQCGEQQLEAGGIVDNRIVCPRCLEKYRGVRFFSPGAWKLLRELTEENLETIVSFNPQTEDIKTIDAWFTNYITFYLPSPMKSEEFVEKVGV